MYCCLRIYFLKKRKKNIIISQFSVAPRWSWVFWFWVSQKAAIKAWPRAAVPSHLEAQLGRMYFEVCSCRLEQDSVHFRLLGWDLTSSWAVGQKPSWLLCHMGLAMEHFTTRNCLHQSEQERRQGRVPARMLTREPQVLCVCVIWSWKWHTFAVFCSLEASP